MECFIFFPKYQVLDAGMQSNIYVFHYNTVVLLQHYENKYLIQNGLVGPISGIWQMLPYDVSMVLD